VVVKVVLLQRLGALIVTTMLKKWDNRLIRRFFYIRG
jgi:hypothetical protein